MGSFIQLLVVASMPVVKFLLITALGLFLALDRINLLGDSAKHHLNQVRSLFICFLIVFYVFSPALVCSYLAQTITLESFLTMWFMPINIMMTFVIGSALGWVVSKLTRPSKHIKGLVISSCSAASEIPRDTGNRRVVIGCLAGLLTGLVLILLLGFFIHWRKKRGLIIKAENTRETSLTRFGFRDLRESTKNFSHKLGGGGFGSVYKGTLPDSTDIAVKRLECSVCESHGEKQFRTEVSAIGNIQHVNLVHLRGFCSEGTNRLLVYEYMPNMSLNTHLFDHKENSNSQILSWKLRYQIGIGVARGLTYLHEKCRDCIIHCDIKPENILLDSNFCAKVADFGLAKLVGREFSRVLTTIRGTRGYLAPEWISGIAITAKADVYSYGMLLFELVSGRRNTSTGKLEFFPTWAMNKLAKGDDVLSIVDPKLEGDVEVSPSVCW